MEVKYDYQNGFCRLLHYNGLWPVKYNGSSGNYHKAEMACRCGDGQCKHNCQVFDNAKETIAIENEWLLKGELMD